MSENKTSRYVKYALGEIVLVVMGILIALQINNWNEDRKVGIFKSQVYQQIYQDIINDSIPIAEALQFYEERNVILNQILLDSIPAIAYDTITNANQTYATIRFTLLTNAVNVIHTKKGYHLFKTFSETQTHKDSLPFYVNDFYAKVLEAEDYSNTVKSTFRKNIQDFQKESWFLDFALERKLNLDYIDYLKHSEDFKLKVFNYKLIAGRNYSTRLRNVQEAAEVLKSHIVKRMKDQ